ncbi:MAG: methyltransferase [Spirochaetota bacterium]|nr:MAG: methyltransferase [Spirochaetota bacterium]
MNAEKKIWTSRERVMVALNHEEPDRVPIDLGGTIMSGINVVTLHLLRNHLGLPEKRVKVSELSQMIGEVEMDLVERLHVDVLPVEPLEFFFGIKHENYKPWKLFDGTPIMVPGTFNIEEDEQGNWLLHDEGDPHKPIAAKMPKNGYYFDDLELIKSNPDLKRPSLDTLREDTLLNDEELKYMQRRTEMLRETTEKALVGGIWLHSGLAIIGSIPDYLEMLILEREFVKEFLHKKHEIIMENLGLFWDAVGENVDIVSLDGNDYGSQTSELFSPEIYDELYMPYYREQFDWVHENTSWKTIMHSCGSITKILPLLVDAGLDIINPVQTSAQGMQPEWLKGQLGDRLTFWGGGVDTQKTLPFGTPETVRKEVEDRIRIFGKNGGFVFCPVHNIQYGTPVENIIAAYDTAYESGKYPLDAG